MLKHHPPLSQLPFRHAQSVLVSLLCLASSACGDAAEPTGGDTLRVIDGDVWDPWTEATQTWTRNAVRVTSHGCSGTLLNREWVLTAAHCFPADVDPADITIRHELADGSVEVAIGEEVVDHPLAAKPHMVDVSLVHLQQPLSPGIASLPLFAGDTDELVGEEVFCAGFGLIEYNPNVSANGVLHSGTFEIIPDPDGPARWYQLDVPNLDGQVMASGDSGGSCWNGSALTGVMKAGNNVNYNRQTSTEAFADWANGIVNPPVVKQVNRLGAECRVINDEPVEVGAGGALRNLGADTAELVCPIRRPLHGPDATVASVPRVFVVDRHPTEDVCCHVNSENPSGNNVRGATECSSGSSSSYQRLALASVYDTESFS